MNGGAGPSSSAVLLLLVVVCALAAVQALPVDAQDVSVLEVGAEMPGLELQDLDGELLDTRSVAGEAAVVLVFFRGAW